jgi:hypothetical protein
VSGRLPERVSAVNVGLPGFAEALREQGAPVVEVDWRPPAGGDPEAVALLVAAWGDGGDRVRAANERVLDLIEAARPQAVAVSVAKDEIPALGEGRALCHAGPPITPDRVCDPQMRAMAAACVLEGWAPDPDAGRALVAGGGVTLLAGNDHGHVGPMTGVCSPSMPVWVVRDEVSGTRAVSTLNEGPGATLWFGVGDAEAIARQRFLRDEVGPLLARLLERSGPVDVLGMAAQGLQMGDELHMRSQATGSLLLKHLLPAFAAFGGEEVARVLAANHHVFLNLTMAAARCATQAAAGVEGSTVVVLMARNGVEAGLQVAGLPGRWFTAPAAGVQDALLREGFTPHDAALDIGDSAVIECIGLGGMAVAAAPAVAAFFGGDASEAAARTRLMGDICAGRSERFRIASLDHAGTPLGIDLRLVVELGITPQITTGVLHASSGAGQIGAGVAHQPPELFRAALEAVVEGLSSASST